MESRGIGDWGFDEVVDRGGAFLGALDQCLWAGIVAGTQNCLSYDSQIDQGQHYTFNLAMLWD